MIRVQALDHFVLRVHDLERSLAFYRDLLELEVLFLEEFRAGARPFVSVRIGEQLLDLVPDPAFAGADLGPHSGFLHFCVRVAGNLEELIPLLQANGVVLVDDKPAWRMGASGWGWSLYVRDPDGYIVELKEGNS
ncbi:Virulence protein [bacterium HR30]|nr:Virulence protein [bacterium HR30]